MKIRNIIYLFSIILVNDYCIAQSINDSILKNVILIHEKDILKRSNDYLIDVVIDYKTTPVFFNESSLTNDFFINKLFEFKPIIIITPEYPIDNPIDHEEYNCIEHEIPVSFYQREYIENKSKVDLFVTDLGNQNRPKLIFNANIEDYKYHNNIIYYHSENFGSFSRRKEKKWKLKEKLDNFIDSFEKRNNIKLGDIYKKTTRKKREHILYFTLSNLNKEQKLNFLQEIRYLHFINKEIVFAPQIFSPSLINKISLELVLE